MPTYPIQYTNTVTNTSGQIYGIFQNTVDVDPPSTSTAIVAGEVIEMDYDVNAAAITGNGHIVAKVGYIRNYNTTHNVPLAVPIEAKFDNNTSGCSVDSVFSCFSQIAANVSGATISNWYGLYADIGSNAGTINSASGVALNIDGNTGTINAASGISIPVLTNSGTINALYGMYFSAQTASIGNKYCLYNDDATANLFSRAPIQTASLIISGCSTLSAVTSAYPPSTSLKGARAMISDATSTTFAAVAAGGGTSTVPIYCDGSNWRIG